MSQILRQYIDDDGLQVTEHTRNGVTVSAIIRRPVPIEPIEPIEPAEPDRPELTQEEIQLQTLLNTELLVIMSEISGL